MGSGGESGSGAAAAAAAPEAAPSGRRLVGFESFTRSNPMSDKFDVQRFHHVEFWCGDATNTAHR